MDAQTGTLYIVATPIGNLEDITLRAIRILKEVDLIAAEDTRHSQKLLNHFGIKKKIVSYYREREVQRSSEFIALLQEGKNIALVSDAGTPCISDPGAILVQAALQNNIRVSPVPGVSAVTAAVSCCGNISGTFLFLGFAPAKSTGRTKLFTAIKDHPYPVIFYESPRRVVSFLKDCYQILGNRQIFWARELTKNYEELCLEKLENLLTQLQDNEIRGEIVIVIWPGNPEVITEEKILSRIYWYQKNSKLKLNAMSREIATELHVSKSQVYQLALQTKKK